LTPLQKQAIARVELHNRLRRREELNEKLSGLVKPVIPECYEFLYEKGRYKVIYGGRGKGASWSISRVLLHQCLFRRMLVLCTREVQNSIADSVHRLLADQIRLLGYSEFFTITQTSIKCTLSGSEFIFRGLNDLTVDNVKSMEGITHVWCAEAHNMGARSWRVLAPTIRTPGSEIWVDLNPEDKDGVTYVKFTKNPPRNSLIKHINYTENPYFTPELEYERQEALDKIALAETDDERLEAQDEYDHVWLGKPRKMSLAAIFGARCIIEDFDTPEGMRFYHGQDFGYSQDPNATVRCYEVEYEREITVNGETKMRKERDLYIDMESFGRAELNDLPALIAKIPTTKKWKVYADCSRPETISHVKSQSGINIQAAEKWQGSVEDGIAYIKGYRRIYIHKTNCPEMAKEATNYKWKVDPRTAEILPVPVDAHNHGWDAVRYALVDRIRKRTSFFT